MSPSSEVEIYNEIGFKPSDLYDEVASEWRHVEYPVEITEPLNLTPEPEQGAWPATMEVLLESPTHS